MKNTLIARKALWQVVVSVSARSAYTGGLEDVHMVIAMMISGQRMSRITKLIRDCHREHCGLIGTNRENRHTGAEVEYSIRHTIANPL
mgnify:CR=1 FL=1